MNDLDPTGRLFAQLIALRLVVQDILNRQASEAPDRNTFLRTTHAGVHDDLTRFIITNGDPARNAKIVAFADAAIDEIFAPLREGPPPA